MKKVISIIILMISLFSTNSLLATTFVVENKGIGTSFQVHAFETMMRNQKISLAVYGPKTENVHYRRSLLIPVSSFSDLEELKTRILASDKVLCIHDAKYEYCDSFYLLDKTELE